jgi:hypothetical protein
MGALRMNLAESCAATITPREEGTPAMPDVKKTAIDLPHELWLRARHRALEEGTTLRDLVIEGLELRLAKKRPATKKEKRT